ncbi:hypothetical protein BH20CHL6_BH20CHL6_13240 [soil metagenome]
MAPTIQPSADPAVLRLIARLAALTHALEARGIYNGAKYLRAAWSSELQALSTGEAGRPEAELARAIREVAGRLEGDRYPTDFDALLEVVAEAVASEGTIPREEAPAIFSCRSCGLLVLAEPPLACPRCDAHALTFREHLPIWFLEPMESGAALAALEAGPGAVALLLGERGDVDLGNRWRDGEWSARDVMAHFVGAEELFGERLSRLLEEDEPDLAARAVWNETPTSDEYTPAQPNRGARELLAAYRVLREQSLVRLRIASPDEWQRAGSHSEWGRVTVLTQAAYFARHEAAHLAQLAAAVQGRIPGHR